MKTLIILMIIVCGTALSTSEVFADTQTTAPAQQTTPTTPTTSTTTTPTTTTQAVDPVSIGDILRAGSNWINSGSSQAPANTSTEYFVESLLGVGQVLVAVGVIVLLIVTAITGIKWITASPDKKAILKQQLIGLVVAAVVIFGAVGIWNLVQSIAKNVEGQLNVAQSTVVTTLAQK